MYMNVAYTTVLVAAVAKYLLGWVWYSALFGTMWESEVKRLKRKSKIDENVAMAIKAVWCFVTSFVLYVIIHGLGTTSAMDGAITGLFVWFGTAFGTQIDDVLFEGQSTELLSIHAGFYAASYALIGAIIGYMS